MTPSGLEVVRILQLPTQMEIADENAQDQVTLLFLSRLEEADQGQTKQKEGERCLVPRPIIHARKGTKGRQEVRFDVWNQNLVFRRKELFKQFVCSLLRLSKHDVQLAIEIPTFSNRAPQDRKAIFPNLCVVLSGGISWIHDSKMSSNARVRVTD